MYLQIYRSETWHKHEKPGFELKKSLVRVLVASQVIKTGYEFKRWRKSCLRVRVGNIGTYVKAIVNFVFVASGLTFVC